jgi:hypothetical protein
LRKINTFQEEIDRQVFVSDHAQSPEEKLVIIGRVTGRISNRALARPMTCGGVEFPESSRHIRKTSKELEIIRMGELDDRAIQTAVEKRNSRNMGY